MTWDRRPRPPLERFWEKVNKTDTCWLWTAATTKNGYGRFGPSGVPIPSPSRRIAELREAGHVIEERPDPTGASKVHEYRLVIADVAPGQEALPWVA